MADSLQSAKEAGLRYVTDADPGLQRKRKGKGFRYVGVDGAPVRDAETLQRIKALVIPPAWTEVWICPNPKGHLQVTGRDARGRKQSRYHPRWRELRDETKYERLLQFGTVLPAIREQVEQDLSLPGISRRRVLATVIYLMETTFIRIGNEEYARENRSYGLTTMRNHHVAINGSAITFKFRGKSGIRHSIDLHDRRLAKIIQRCQDLPGCELFQYIDPEGEPQTIDSADVNEYIREISHQDFTAKDFRTWAGTVLALVALREFEIFESETQAKKNIVKAIKHVAMNLGNTPYVCRKCYVHPAVLECYLKGRMAANHSRSPAQRSPSSLRPAEKALIKLLRKM